MLPVTLQRVGVQSWTFTPHHFSWRQWHGNCTWKSLLSRLRCTASAGQRDWCKPTARSSRACGQAPKGHSAGSIAHPQARERRVRRKCVLHVQLSGHVAVAVGRACAAAAACLPRATAGAAPLAERAGAPALARLPRLKMLRVLRERGARAQRGMQRACCGTRFAQDVGSRQPRASIHSCRGPRLVPLLHHHQISANSLTTSTPVAWLCRLAVSQDSVAGPHPRLRAPCLRSRRPGSSGSPARASTGAMIDRQEYGGGALP